MDSIATDVPSGTWFLSKDPVTNLVTIRSLLWPGFYAYHQAGTPDCGYTYFGTGEQNNNLGFML